MYVDRRLASIQAVQTLSRLNRSHQGKDTTYILDFVNSSEEILAAFKTYYATAELEDGTDPNLVHDLRANSTHRAIMTISRWTTLWLWR
jgi:type I restriction enzyme R subunit